MAKIAQVLACPTCAAVEAVLRAGRVPGPVASRIAQSKKVKALDKSLIVKAVRVKSKYSKLMSKHLKATNKKARKKDGSFRSGYDQRRVMQIAQKCVRKEMK